MEDDNAMDVFKWIFGNEVENDLSDEMLFCNNGRQQKVRAKVRGNLLGIESLESPMEPILVVLERTHVEIPKDDEGFQFLLIYSTGSMRFSAKDEKQREKWMIRMSTCSHRMIQAELDEIADRYFNTPSNNTAPTVVSALLSFYLINPFRKSHKFSISHPMNVHSRKIVSEEIMWESKLSSVLPQQMIKLYLKWTGVMKELIEQRLWAVPNDNLECVHNCLRHLSSMQETYINSLEFLTSYSGPSYRPSSEKLRVDFGSVPTNLHVQQFCVEGTTYNFLTCGAAAAMPLRFVHGGLSRLRVDLHSSIDNAEHIDHILDSRFFYRRNALQTAKFEIGELSRRSEVDWNILKSEGLDDIGVDLLTKVKQLNENLIDLLGSFPGVGKLIDYLNECSRAAGRHKLKALNSVVPESLENQLDNIEASIISLNTKLAVLQSVPKGEVSTETLSEYEKSARHALNATLDALLQLIESLQDAQFLGFVLALRKPSDCQLFYHIQLRSDLVLSQSITIASTAILVALDNNLFNSSYPLLLTAFSFLSCFGDERGMMEDARECWASFQDRVAFKFIPCTSTVSSTCIPTASGDRSKILVQLPLPQSTFETLPEKLRMGETFLVYPVLWNLGINHEATFSQSIARDSSLEETINTIAAKAMQNYLLLRSDVSQAIKDCISELNSVVNSCPSKKNTTIYRLSMAANFALGGIPIISCKSGKDRTSMAVTLEEGRMIRENCGVTAEQMTEMVVCLRRDGVRRENCRKNVLQWNLVPNFFSLISI